MSQQPLQLALDIGTRKVLGLVYEGTDRGIHIVASLRREHPDRAMLHGQIQDVKAVAKVIRDIVSELEAETGQKLTGARVAAAGRALRTSTGQSFYDAGTHEPISDSRIEQLQWEAVADAQARMYEMFSPEERSHGYYCVGYSVVRQWMDGASMGSLAGQRGRKLQLEVLATFLPRTVVDSLDAALTQANLELEGLSLEPIAALEAAVPKTMRHLNLCLVDIGAGTSDIALTRDGTVFAYAMTPQAGDGITEAVSRRWLLDFPIAEKLKRQARPGRKLRFNNILGQKQELAYEEYTAGIAEAVDALAESIAASIAEWNGDVPDAVLLVGGGSLTPGLTGKLSESLGLDEARVAVRDRKAVQGVSGRGLPGPDSVTPLGIALLARGGANLPMVRVRVEGRWVRLFQPGACTVAEALRAAGFSLKSILNAHGPGMTVTVNGAVIVVPGRRGQPGKVILNGDSVPLNHVVADRDEIEVELARPEPPPSPTVAQILALEEAACRIEQRYVVWLGERRALPLRVDVNGELSSLDQRLKDRDVVQVRPCLNLAEIEQADPGGSWDTTAQFHCSVNGKQVRLPPPEGSRSKLLISGHEADANTPLHEGAQIETSLEVPPGWPTLHEVLPYVQLGSIHERRSGQRLSLRVNGKEAQFTTILKTGDRVEVGWESGSGETGGSAANVF